MATAAPNKVDRFLRLLTDRGGSDLHLSVGRPPMLRLSGAMEKIRYRTIQPADFVDLLRPISPPDRWRELEETGDTDFAYQLEGLARFRVNLFRQQRGMAAVLRMIPSRIMSLDELGLPPQIRRVTSIRSGLVLVTGPTGSGKSTTLAAIVDHLNATRDVHVITLEDPIEFVHRPKRSLVHQREIGIHATSFADALRAAGREDPDVLLVGEMRDLETIALALSAAERGTLVFATLHTNSAVKTVDRIVNVFPATEQDGIRAVLGEALRAVIAQQLLPREGCGRVAAIEILFGTPAVGSMIREGKTPQITSAIQTGSSAGMVEMDSSIRRLLEEGAISRSTAYDAGVDKEAFRHLLEDAEESPEPD